MAEVVRTRRRKRKRVGEIRRALCVGTGIVILGCAGLPSLPPPGLDALTVAPAGTLDGYTDNRAALFGGWADTDGNGCPADADALLRDLRDVRRAGQCGVTSGVLAADPYTGKRVAFTEEGADEVEIDHVVALAEAWRSGASGWVRARRVNLANDPTNLLTTAREQNRAKSDHDPARWRPAHGQCEYARRVVTVKTRYEMTIDPAEKTALREMLNTC